MKCGNPKIARHVARMPANVVVERPGVQKG